MLKYKKGCLIKAAQNGEVNVIAHQCNCFNTMKSGIAPQIAKAFPDAQIVDNQTPKGDINKLGKLTVGLHFDNLVGDIDHIAIFNLYGQYDYGRDKNKTYTNYEALSSSLSVMRQLVDESDKIGFPKLGCGLAGGDWNIVSKMIEEIFNGCDVTIYEL